MSVESFTIYTNGFKVRKALKFDSRHTIVLDADRMNQIIRLNWNEIGIIVKKTRFKFTCLLEESEMWA